MTHHNDDTSFLKVHEVARLLRIGRSSAYELCNNPTFPAFRVGRAIRVPRKELMDWIADQSRRDRAS